MGSNNEVKLVLTAEDNISSAIKKVTEALGNTGLGQAVTAISTSFVAMKEAAELVGKAISKVNEFVMEGVNDAANAENVNKRLAMSMSLVGQYSDKAFISVNEWAAGLETLTGQSDESLRSLVALGLQTGLNTEQSKKAAQAALDLAAATGTDLDTAFRQMTMTLSGSAGRLAKTIPELKNLTQAQLESGAAIDVIAKKYDGFAANAANSYTGALAKFHSQIGNVKEELGRLIAQNPVVIAAFENMAAIFGKMTEAAQELSTWMLTNGDDILLFAKSVGVAALAVGAYLVWVNAMTIATTLATVASIGLAGVMAVIASPITLVIAGIALLGTGLFFLMKNIDLVTGALKFGLGKALEWILIPLNMYVSALASVVGVFNADWGKALQGASDKITAFSKDLQKSGQAQMDAAKAANAHGKAVDTNALMIARSTAGLTQKITEQEQALASLRQAFSRAQTIGQAAFDALKDFAPRMSLEMFQKDAKQWTESINNLKKQAEGLKVRLQTEVQTDQIKEELEKVNQQIRFAEESQKALKIKTAIETRGAVTKETEIQLGQIKNREISVQAEVSQMKLDAAKSVRDQLIAIEEQRLLRMRGLGTLDAQAGVEAKTQAVLDANKVELDAYKAQLDAQKQLAISVESQKQAELANLKANLMSSNTASGAQAKQDVEVIAAQQKQAQLQALRTQNLLSEEAYQQQLTQIEIDQINSRTQMEIALNEQRAVLLGDTPEALALRLQNAQIQNEAENEILLEKYANEEMTDAEFQLAQEQAEQNHAIRMSEIKEQALQKEVENQTKLKNTWQATLAQIRLEQEKHGQVMGMVQGIQNSEQFKGLNTALSNTATLMQSKNAEQFKIGQAAAIAQAAIQIPLSAISAYTSMASIPIIGPALGIAAAAAAIAAGAMNIAQIKAQRPPGSAAHGGIDEVPKSMNNSTFLLKAGERVVQPDQNKALGEAVDKINSGAGMGGGNHVYITVQGNADERTVETMATKIMDVLREKSERGVPVINARGIVNG